MFCSTECILGCCHEIVSLLSLWYVMWHHSYQGEEITFDYNFVRVGGAVAKKCECRASNCRGFIGVDPDTPHTVVEIESDDGEDPEPVMLLLESDEEIDRLDKSKERLAKKARMAADLNTTEQNGSEHGGVKRKFVSAGGVKDMNPKRVRRVKTTGMSKLNSHEVSRRRGFTGGNRVDGSRLGIRNNHYSEGGLLVSFSLDLSVCSGI